MPDTKKSLCKLQCIQTSNLTPTEGPRGASGFLTISIVIFVLDQNKNIDTEISHGDSGQNRKLLSKCVPENSETVLLKNYFKVILLFLS